jgi:hypothetical protein
MDEKEAKAQLAKELKQTGISDADWKALVKKGHFTKGMRVGDVEWEDLVREARDVLEHRRDVLEETGLWRNPRRKTEKEEPEYRAKEKVRAEALGEYIALRATMDPQVRHFRKVVLEGEPLTVEQAYTFVYSPANQCFPIAWFQERQIPMREHLASSHPYKYYDNYHENWGEDDQGRLYRFHDIYIEPPGETFRRIVYEPLNEDERESLSIPLLSSDPASSGREDWPVEIGSVLDILRRVCDRLVKASGYAWSEEQATWFVLTGEATQSNALDGRADTVFGDIITRGTITLTAEPWVPAESIERYYRKMQRSMLRHDNRPLSDKSLALFRFVMSCYRDAVTDFVKPDARGPSPSDCWRVGLKITKRMSPHGGWEEDLSPFEGDLQGAKIDERPSWRDLQERWNRSCIVQEYLRQEWCYEDVRNFRRAVLEATRLLLIPPYEDELALELFDPKDKLP